MTFYGMEKWELDWLYKIADLGPIDRVRIYRHLFKTWYILRGFEFRKLAVPADVFRKFMQFHPDRDDVFVEIKEEYHAICNEYIDHNNTQGE